MIRGYPDRSSVEPGDKLTLHVATDSPQFRVDFYRVGAGLQLLTTSDWMTGQNVAPPPHPDGTPGRASPAEAWGWPAYDFPVPNDWTTGIYVAMFVEGSEKGMPTTVPDATNTNGLEKEWFIVKPTVPTKSGILYKKNVTTRTAYGEEGGSSLYKNPVYITAGRQGHKVSLHRPSGANDLMWWDVPFIGWLEKNGYSVDYFGDIDLHQDANLLRPYKLMITAGHDEYWSADMRDHVEAFIATGGNVAFFGGNTCWWRIHLVDDDTAFMCDSDHHVGSEYPHVPATDQWWTPAPNGVGNPENGLTGVSYRNGGAWLGRPPLGFSIQNAALWVFAGTGLSDGDVLGETVNLVGYECDGAAFKLNADGIAVPTGLDGTPADFVILGVAKLSPIAGDYYDDSLAWHCPARESSIEGPPAATMGLCSRSDGAGTVFTASTTEWPAAVGNGADLAVEQITRNVLNMLTA